MDDQYGDLHSAPPNRKTSLRRIVLIVLRTVALGYAAVCVFMYFYQYRLIYIPSKQLEMIGSNIVLLIHSAADIVKDDLINSNIIFHAGGKRGVIQRGKHYFVAPGHLRDKEHEGQAATFALFELDKKSARVTFHGINGDVLSESTLSITKQGKIMVQG